MKDITIVFFFFFVSAGLVLPATNMQYDDNAYGKACGLPTQQLHTLIRTSRVARLNIALRYVEHGPIFIEGNDNFRSIARAENWPGDGTPSFPYVISGLNITASSESLIFIGNTTRHFQISNCFLNGLSITDTGIVLSNVDQGTIRNNLVANCTNEGIALYSSTNNTITKNIVYNSENGIFIGFNSPNNGSNNNAIAHNTIFRNDYGIQLDGSDNNRISHNNVSRNTYGLYLSFSANNTSFNNNFLNNSFYGVFLFFSNNAQVKWNEFIGNNWGSRSQAFDNGMNNTFAFNYWGDWINPDANRDGFVDDPYSIDGSADNHDSSPLVNAMDTPPVMPPLSPLFQLIMPGILLGAILIEISILIVFARRIRYKVREKREKEFREEIKVQLLTTLQKFIDEKT